jgi:hypothetical protein
VRGRERPRRATRPGTRSSSMTHPPPSPAMRRKARSCRNWVAMSRWSEASILRSRTSLGNRSARQRPTSVPPGAVRTGTLADGVPDTQPPSSPATMRRSAANAPQRVGAARCKVAMRTVV